MKFNGLKVFFALLSVSLIWGCAVPEPKLQEGPTAEVTFDGLVRVDNTTYQRVWVRKDINLADYDKILLKGADVHYRAVKKPVGIRASSSAQFFPMDEKEKDDFEKTVSEVFDREMKKSKYFKIVDEPGPKTLTVIGTLIDVVSRMPPDMPGRDVYLSNYGEATLVIEVRDSMSDEILARAVDRRAAQPFGGEIQSFPSNSVTAKAEVSRVMTQWANLLREGIDYLHDLPPVE